MTANISVLICHNTVSGGRRRFSATKTWRHNFHDQPECIGFKAGREFLCQPQHVDGIRGLGRLLRRLQGRPDIFLIRGIPAPDLDLSKPVRRMKRPDHDNADKVWFVEGDGQSWVMLDIDKKPVPPEIDPVRDPEGAVSYLIENCLPPELRDVTFVWQWSSSTGMQGAGLLSAHLWFWLDRPMTEAELKAWFFTDPWLAENESHIDPTLFRLVQPHYTAAPVFEDNISDPLPRRLGARRGLRDTASLAVPEIVEPRSGTTGTKRSHSAGSAGPTLDYDTLSTTHGFEAKLALIGDGMAGEVRLQGFHRVLTAAAASYVSEHGKSFDRKKLKERMRAAIRSAPKRAGREGDVGHYSSDEYLDSAIESAIERFGEDAESRPNFEDTVVIDGVPPSFP